VTWRFIVVVPRPKNINNAVIRVSVFIFQIFCVREYAIDETVVVANLA
jgi:hypothetical protein